MNWRYGELDVHHETASELDKLRCSCIDYFDLSVDIHFVEPKYKSKRFTKCILNNSFIVIQYEFKTIFA